MKDAQRAPGTPFNRSRLQTTTLFKVVLWRLRYKLSFNDLAEMFSVELMASILSERQSGAGRRIRTLNY